jgi:hypothetical protein
MRCLFVLLPALFVAAPTAAESASDLSLTELLAGTAGNWRGELQYRDYQSNAWMGLPMQVSVTVQPDRVTLIRTAAFDDGPQTGIVYITTVSQLDPASGQQAYAMFRKGRAAEAGSAQLTLAAPPRDAAHWSIVATESRRDGDSMAQLRETTTRNGAELVTLKEVNPVDDGKDEWLPRNRTVLTLVEG